MTSDEFLRTAEYSSAAETEADPEARRFMRMRLHFDPYSATAVIDYEKLKQRLSEFDIVGMLSRELSKTRVHQPLTRRLINAVRHLDPVTRDDAIRSILKNLRLLSPLMPVVLIMFRDLIEDIDANVRQDIFSKLRALLGSDSFVSTLPVTTAYAVRVLAFDPSDEADAVLDETYARSRSPMVRRDTILAMCRHKSYHWLSDLRRKYVTLTQWERQSLLVCSHELGDEGKKWLDNIRKTLGPHEQLLIEWVRYRRDVNRWRVPI